MTRPDNKVLTNSQRLAQDASDWLLNRIEEWARKNAYGRVRVEILFENGRVKRINLAQDESVDGG